MEQSGLGTDAIAHIALVVRDVEATAARYARIFNKTMPPIRITGGSRSIDMRHRGEPADGQAKLAMFRMGHIALELIEPLGGRSVWQEHLDEHGPGVHHIGLIVPSLDDAVSHLAAHEHAVLQEAGFAGGRYAYVDTDGSLGVILELLEVR